MKRYEIRVCYPDQYFDIEAESQEQALTMAWDEIYPPEADIEILNPEVDEKDDDEEEDDDVKDGD